MNDRDRHESGFLSGLIFGVFCGAGLYYFLTSTEEGKKAKKKFREQFEEKSEEVFKQLADLVREVEEKGEEFRQKAKEIQVELEEKTKGTSETMAREVQEGLTQIERLRERGRSASRKFFLRNGKPLS